MTACSDIGEEDADLAVLHASAHAAILWSDASGVFAAFGKAAFIQHQDGEECFGVSVRRPNGRRLQGLDEEATQLITHAVLVPDCFGEQALDAIRVQEPGVFSDLPAIFPGNLAEDGLQVEQGMAAWFGTGEVGRHALVQEAQGQRPGADLTKGGADLRGCGMLMMLHAVLVSDGWLEQAVVVLLACHISTRSARSGCGSREDSQENASLEKCHCSETSTANTGAVAWLTGLGSPSGIEAEYAINWW